MRKETQLQRKQNKKLEQYFKRVCESGSSKGGIQTPIKRNSKSLDRNKEWMGKC